MLATTLANHPATTHRHHRRSTRRTGYIDGEVHKHKVDGRSRYITKPVLQKLLAEHKAAAHAARAAGASRHAQPTAPAAAAGDKRQHQHDRNAAAAASRQRTLAGELDGAATLPQARGLQQTWSLEADNEL